MMIRTGFMLLSMILCKCAERHFTCSKPFCEPDGTELAIAEDCEGNSELIYKLQLGRRQSKIPPMFCTESYCIQVHISLKPVALIPPKPNFSQIITAKPDPFVTDDPTSKAKLTLKRDLFSNENGEIIFYALLVALQDNRESPQNGTWNCEVWPALPNWMWENTSYQVTPPRWNPFLNSVSSEATYTLGDDSCDSARYYCNVPLRENTKYALKIRAFTNSGYQDTDSIFFETLGGLPLTKIVSMLAACLLITAAAVSFSIFNFGWVKRIRIPGRKTKGASPVPEALSQKSFLKYAQELLNTPGRLGNEFHLLGTLSSDVSTLCLHAQRIDNRHKNRYGNILPFDMTRVKLSIIDDDPSTDYVNASFVKGYKQEVQYIACQGPKEETCHDFYRMIIEQNIELIVMLTKLTENGMDKCYKYYPNMNEVLKFKEITVVCKQIEVLEVCTKRVLAISTSGRSLVVTQLHFEKWLDFESPGDAEIMLKFCELTNKHLCKGCTLVHCSAGAGRTGTFIAIHILLQELKTGSKISVFNTVLKLRQQRINMVQTEAQLGYIYKCISRAIEKSLPRTKEI